MNPLHEQEWPFGPQTPSCSFCLNDATACLLPADLDFDPDDPYPNLCDLCLNVLSAAMRRLPNATDEWCFVDLAWMLRPITDEEVALWAAEQLLALNNAGGVA